METEKIQRLNAFLALHGTSCDILSKSKVQQFEKIDDAIQERVAHIKKAKEIIKKQSINVLNISADTKIARKTFYNNDLLRLYVEYRAADFYNDLTENQEKIKALKENIRTLENSMQNFILRDIEIENLRKELEVTQKELSHVMIAYEELQRKYEKLLTDREQSTSKPSCKVLIPKGGKLGSYFEV